MLIDDKSCINVPPDAIKIDLHYLVRKLKDLVWSTIPTIAASGLV